MFMILLVVKDFDVVGNNDFDQSPDNGVLVAETMRWENGGINPFHLVYNLL